jgi:hypothetical protein
VGLHKTIGPTHRDKHACFEAYIEPCKLPNARLPAGLGEAIRPADWFTKTSRVDFPLNPEIPDFLFAGETTHRHINAS